MFFKLTKLMCKEKKYYSEYIKEVNKIIKVWSERSIYSAIVIDEINSKIQEAIKINSKDI